MKKILIGCALALALVFYASIAEVGATWRYVEESPAVALGN